MCQAIAGGGAGVFRKCITIHWLQKMVVKLQAFKLFRRRSCLRVNEFQFLSFTQYKICTRFRAYADPVDSWRGDNCTVRLHGNLETALMQRID